MKEIIILIIAVLLSVVGQLFLKAGMNKAEIEHIKLIELGKKMLFNYFVMSGLLLYVASTLLWIIVLSDFELSYAYPMVSAGYFFVTLASVFVFKEEVSVDRWISVFVIIFGVILIGLS